jgi:hypothetical protein
MTSLKSIERTSACLCSDRRNGGWPGLHARDEILRSPHDCSDNGMRRYRGQVFDTAGRLTERDDSETALPRSSNCDAASVLASMTLS